MLAAVLVVGRVEPGPHVALDRRALLAEAVVEPREVRQVGHVLHERFHARLERRALGVGALLELFVDPARDLREHLHEVRDVAERVVDVRLQQHAVA